MANDKQHEVVRDATLTFGHILKTYLPPRLGGRAVEVVYEAPDQKTVDEVAAQGKILLSMILIDTLRSTGGQTMEQPIVREEDDEGNLVEYRLGPPTYISPRYLVTCWAKDPLESQAIQGLVMQLLFDRPQFLPEDVQGVSIHGEERCPIDLDEQFKVEDQIKLWQALGKTFRPSLVYSLRVRMESAKRVAIRRVKERILDYKKVQ
jgi:hypothetical protein